MTTRFDPKDPAESITAGFDFSPLGSAVTLVSVTLDVRTGIDPGAGSMLAGPAVVAGAQVYQRVQGGIAGCDYALRCLVDVGGDRVMMDAILPVRSRPNPIEA